MISGNMKECRNAAARLKEAHASEVAIARELPATSEEHTPLSSTALKKEARAESRHSW
jgi:ribose 1,5-bisphosphokinase PhnN